MKVKVYDFEGKEKGEYDFKGVFEKDINKALMAQYVRVYRANQRQGTSKIKDKSEVAGGGRKPHSQKGTGRARAGSTRSPLWVGGGVVHGPTPRDHSLKFMKKMRISTLRSVFVDKANDKNVNIFEYPSEANFSTKKAKKFLDIVAKDKKVLVIHDNKESLYESYRNVPYVNVSLVSEFCAYDILSCESLFIENDAVSLFEKRLTK